MSRAKRSVTIMIHKEGELESRSFRFPLWFVRAATVTGIGLAVLIILSAVLYMPIVRTAARVPGLTREVRRLTEENQQVHQLAASLEQAERRYNQLRTMLGADVVPQIQRLASDLPRAYALIAKAPRTAPCYDTLPGAPRFWPLDEPGVITRGTVHAGSSEEVHTGLDIAVPNGTPIRAAGGGIVARAGDDPEYGLFIQLDHPEDYQSMYGHASRLLVAVGDSVQAGQVIGLSGSTGRSTAPHLHFEILRGGRSIDPSSQVKQECTDGHLLVRGG